MVVCALLFGLLTSCSKIQEPKFKTIQSFKLNNIGLQKADVSFSVVYYNPNEFGVSVKEAVVDVYVDSIFMGKFTQAEMVQVDKKADFSIPLVGSVDVARALKLGVENVVNKEVKLSANGSVRVGKAGVYVTQLIKHEGRHRLNLGI